MSEAKECVKCGKGILEGTLCCWCRIVGEPPSDPYKRVFGIAESSPVDLREAARKWLTEYLEEIEDVEGRNLLDALRPDLEIMLTAFYLHTREGR